VAQIYYSDRQIDKIHEAGRVAGQCLAIVKDMVAPGMTTRKIDEAVAAHIKKAGGTSPFLNYQLPGKIPFPATICASVNEVVVHGIPDDRPLVEGDLVSIDCGVRLNGYIGDTAWTFPIGKPSAETQKLLQAGKEALYAGIKAARPKGPLGEVSRAIQTLVEARGFSVVRDYVGHGVGMSLHEEPQVPNYVKPGDMLPLFRTLLKPGMVFAIEPMVNEGTAQVTSEDKDWPVSTADNRRSVHFEHTVAIRADKVEILTLWDGCENPL